MRIREDIQATVHSAEKGGYVASHPDTGTTTQGETVEEAVSNLREAVELYLENELGEEK